jgi:type VI secretion system secreted protein VgrG
MTSFVAHRRDSRIFWDTTIFAVVEAVFSAWQRRVTLAPAWRLDIADESVYPLSSLTTITTRAT